MHAKSVASHQTENVSRTAGNTGLLPREAENRAEPIELLLRRQRIEHAKSKVTPSLTVQTAATTFENLIVILQSFGQSGFCWYTITGGEGTQGKSTSWYLVGTGLAVPTEILLLYLLLGVLETNRYSVGFYFYQ